jgi:hypothetical protein
MLMVVFGMGCGLHEVNKVEQNGRELVGGRREK